VSSIDIGGPYTNLHHAPADNHTSTPPTRYELYEILYFTPFDNKYLLILLKSTQKQCSGPSVLWRCWLGGRKGIRPVKNWVVSCWCGYLSGLRCRFAYGSADAIATHYLLLQW